MYMFVMHADSVTYMHVLFVYCMYCLFIALNAKIMKCNRVVNSNAFINYFD